MSTARRVSSEDEALLPSFAPLDDADGLGITDPIERRYFELFTGGPVEPEPTDVGRLGVPVDRAVEIKTDEISVPQINKGFVRNANNEIVAELGSLLEHDLPAGTYTIDITAPIKLYFRVTAPLKIEVGAFKTHFVFGELTNVLVGVRSYHKRPAATIKTTDDPIDVMRAISYFGSALKTTGSDRSYPTLRGHPPDIELGDELSIPAGLERPETGVRIEVPPDLGPVFVVAPLAYYLGAEVIPGPSPRIVTDTGFEHHLDGPDGFEAEVERVLRQTFFLDCITRTEGDYPVDLHERRAVESLVDIDFTDVYQRPLAEQLEAYLSVPFSLIEEEMPDWKLTTHVAPEGENVETLPFLVDDLALIRSPRATTVSRDEAQSAAIKDFMRDAPTRSATATSPSSLPNLIQPESTDSLEQAWVGEDAPLGASKATIEAFRNRLDREARDGDIDITVVCNDPEMIEEYDLASGVYRSREEIPFDVTLYTELDVQRMRFVLETEADFFHYIGHIDDEGIQCEDGKLDIADLDSVGVDTFFLNACRSYDQGLKLIDRGAIGGVVTLDDVLDSGALRVGETLARLLNRGFPLRAALNIARDRSIVGGQYLVVGDGNIDIAHAESQTPVLVDIETLEEGYALRLETYPVREHGMGTIFQPNVAGNEEWYLTSGSLDTFHVEREYLEAFLNFEPGPVRIDGQFTWSDSIDLDDH